VLANAKTVQAEFQRQLQKGSCTEGNSELDLKALEDLPSA
jgi:hypothetical protein